LTGIFEPPCSDGLQVNPYEQPLIPRSLQNPSDPQATVEDLGWFGFP
jgi:hypothetical protein